MIEFGNSSHVGLRRELNEDTYYSDSELGLWLVADGMGGHEFGEVASALARDAVVREVRAGKSLTEAIRSADEDIIRQSKRRADSLPMGTTMVALRVNDNRFELGWVGDSRAYLWRGNVLRQLTRDHSYLEVLREQENLSETQLRGHPNKNLVTQTLGIGTPEPSLINEPLRKGDWLLLCSDGLNDELEDGEIAQILRTNAAPDAAADALIAAALARGGRDNVSAVVVEYDGPNGVSFDQKTILWLAVLGGAFAAILLAVLWWWLYGR